MPGQTFLVRYADDFIACFQYEEDARQFMTAMTERLAAFGLEVEPSKTALLRFGSDAQRYDRDASEGGSSAFNFLGLTHYVGTSRSGRFVVGRKTDGKRMRKKLQEVNRKLRELRIKGGGMMVAYLRQHLQGHIQYYGISGNSRCLKAYVYHSACMLYKWLNRRSQKRSITAERFWALMRNGLMPTARIIHNLYPKPAWKT